MKIAIINQHVEDYLGGSESQCDNIAREFALKKYDVVYIAPNGKSNDYRRNYKVITTDVSSTSIIRTTLKEKPDIIYWRFNLTHFYKFARKVSEKKIPIIFAISNLNDTKPWLTKFHYQKNGKRRLWFSIKKMLSRRLNYEGFKYVKGVTSLNPDCLNIIPVKEQIFIPNFVIREKEPFLWPRPFVLWVSNIKSHKRPEIFIELTKEFIHRDVDFIMVGKPGAHLNLDDKSILPEKLFYLGQKSIPDVNGMLKECLFLVHTCQPEGFGNIFIQAWLQGKPTISFDFDPGGFISKHNIGEVAKGKYDLFVKQVDYYLSKDNIRNQAGSRAMEFATKNFSASRSINNLERFFLKILDDQ
jgi:glycosyltransferase involved in cell wall biosynthesis